MSEGMMLLVVSDSKLTLDMAELATDLSLLESLRMYLTSWFPMVKCEVVSFATSLCIIAVQILVGFSQHQTNETERLYIKSSVLDSNHRGPWNFSLKIELKLEVVKTKLSKSNFGQKKIFELKTNFQIHFLVFNGKLEKKFYQKLQMLWV